MSEHLTAAELKLVLDQELSPQRMGEIGRHLVEGCLACRSMMARAYQPSQEPLTPEEGAGYDRVINSVIGWAVRAKERLDRKSEPLRPASAFVEGDERLSIYEELLKRSWALRHDKPGDMLELAQIAVHVAQDLDPEIHGARKVADYQARAWGELGNAYRAVRQHQEAEQAFGKAFQLLERGTEDGILKARLYYLYASLLGAQKKFDLAFENLDLAVDLYQEVNDLHSVGRVLVSKAVYLHRSDRLAEAIITNELGSSLIDEKNDLDSLHIALHNQLWFLVACGQYTDAKMVLLANDQRIHDASKNMAIRLRWIDGEISYCTADYGAAEMIFKKVREKFEAEALDFSAASVALDVVMAQMRLGKYCEAKEMAIEVTGVFATLKAHREVLAAIERLRHAFLMDQATIALVEQVNFFIREWQLNPEICFQSN